MTDRPSDDGNRTRSDAASRLAALFADVTEETPPASPEAPTEAPASDEGPARRRVVRGRSHVAPVAEGTGDGGSVPESSGAEAEGSEASDPSAASTRSGAPGAEATVAFDMSDMVGGDPEGPAGPDAAEAVPDAEVEAPDAGGEPDEASTVAATAPDDESRPDRASAGAEPSKVSGRVNEKGTGPDGPSARAEPSAASARVHEGRGGPDREAAAAPGPAPDAPGPADADDGESSALLALSRATAGSARTGRPTDRPDPRLMPRRGSGAPAPAAARAGAAAAAAAPAALAPDPEVDAPRLRRVTLRAVAFGAAFLILLAAVPALGWIGKERLLDSRGGDVVDGTREAGDPGYKALVEPTQTALVIQRATPEGPVVATTLLALGMGQTGGSVIQIPLDTETRNPVFALDRLGQVAEMGMSDRLTDAVEDRLNVAIPTTIELDDSLLASLVAPVAPLAIDNPDSVITDTGQEFDAGEIQLSAEELGPFLRAGGEVESELARLARNEVVWTAWLDAIGQSDTTDSVGPATTGIGPFLRTLSGAGAKADGEEVVAPVVETLDVEEQTDADIPDAAELPDSFDVPESGDDGSNVRPLVPAPGFDEQVLEAVPFPRSPGGFARYNLKLLNGAAGEEIPRTIINDLLLRGAALTTLGNAASFGADATTVEYTNDGWKDLAELAGQTLGGAEVSLMSPARAEAEGDDIVITIGQDVLDRYAE